MNKLIELLNKYAHTYSDRYDDTGEEIEIKFLGHYDQCFHYTVDNKEGIQTLVDDVVISGRYGFIQWLVENDKIDLEKFPQIMEYSDYESLLMLLSISDTPIEDLVSYLK